MDKDDPDRFKGIPQRPTKGLILVADWDKAREVFTSMEEGQKGNLFGENNPDYWAFIFNL